MYHRIFLIVLLTITLACNRSSENTVKVHISSLNTNTDVNIRALSVVDGNIVWAGASAGTILRSTNNGKNWEIIKIEGEEKNDFRSIHAWDSLAAIVFGVQEPNFGYKTTNGGKTWQLVYTDNTKGAFFNSVKFANDSIGLAVSDAIDGQLYLIKTTDAGNTWKRVKNTPQQKEGEYNFAASNTCIEFLPSGKAWIATGGSIARVFYSNDFGKTWEVSNTPIACGNESTGIFSIDFMDDLNGIIVGGTYNQPELNKNIAAYTINGGITWKLSASMPTEFRSCVQTIKNPDTTFSIAIGKTGLDYSFDNGKNWNFIDSTGYFTFCPIPNKNAGFAAGANGKIAKIEFIQKNRHR